jgi:thiol-disulfide isomerase/thioredoxin
MSVRSWVVGALVLALVAGCTGDSAGAQPPSPLAGCAGLDTPPAGAAAGSGTAGDRLPELTLDCFTGGEPFALADLRGPAVVNLWASWCTPCREELPALQRYADQAAGQVHVLGVVTRDRRSAAVSVAEDLGITFPALDDPEERLLAELPRLALPATLFVDAAGRVRYVHQTGALDEQAVERYVSEQLGVVS